jgi:hypothetical protein
LNNREIALNAIDPAELEKVAAACRRGLLSLASAKGSTFNGFPRAACGPAAEIVGRILKETLQYEGVYVCGCHHPQLKSESSHAWFEVGDFIIDITYDQFQGTGLSGWVFKGGTGWHAQFTSLERRTFCTPDNWTLYPYDGYKTVLEEADKVGLSKQ